MPVPKTSVPESIEAKAQVFMSESIEARLDIVVLVLRFPIPKFKSNVAKARGPWYSLLSLSRSGLGP